MTRTRLDERVTASLALGLAGLFFFNVVFGPLAAGLGLWGVRRGQRAGWIGVALGVADLVVLAALVATRGSVG